jgi:hypothetical protein
MGTAMRDDDPAGLREYPPVDPDDLHSWLVSFTGLDLVQRPVCAGHTTPFAVLAGQYFDRPALSLTHGPRGGGKSLAAALLTHCTARWSRDRWGAPHSARVLGGSLAQSRQVYEALGEFVFRGGGSIGSDASSIAGLFKTEAYYANGSSVSIISASEKAVRGPHVPTLILDEVDEIDDQRRQDAMGMCMAKNGIPGSVAMMSTWHNVDGPMGGLVEEARGGSFPYYHFCIFDVLEHCPAGRSGAWVGGEPGYEHCPECPIRRWCHADRDPALDRGPDDPSSWAAHGAGGGAGAGAGGAASAGASFGQPKAKRAAGHYAIDSLVQKVRGGVSVRTFESDYLCMGPRADGLWFPNFDESTHVSPSAEYDPSLPCYLAIDAGTSRCTGAVWFQVHPGQGVPAVDPSAYPGIRSVPLSAIPGYGRTARGQAPPPPTVSVFADYYAEDLTAEPNALAIREHARRTCGDRMEAVLLDPAAGQRTGAGPVVAGIYAKEFGERRTAAWPMHRVLDGLALLESFVMAADGSVGLAVHPRCGHLIKAMKVYRRKKIAGIFRDEPEDPSHPAEDLVDALRGGLMYKFPDGRGPERVLPRTKASGVF